MDTIKRKITLTVNDINVSVEIVGNTSKDVHEAARKAIALFNERQSKIIKEATNRLIKESRF